MCTEGTGFQYLQENKCILRPTKTELVYQWILNKGNSSEYTVGRNNISVGKPRIQESKYVCKYVNSKIKNQTCIKH